MIPPSKADLRPSTDEDPDLARHSARARAIEDAGLVEKIRSVHDASGGPYVSPRGYTAHKRHGERVGVGAWNH